MGIFVGAVLPLLLVFGLYHLLTWFNIFRINDRVYWKRVALASAISHLLLATGFFIFLWVEYQATREFSGLGLSFGSFLFTRSEFWRITAIFDTVPMLVILALFTLLDNLGQAVPGVVPLTIAIVYVIGSVQWYFLGGGIGALVERFWSGLKTGEDEEWQLPDDD